jgi:hypothetical protein
VAFVFVVCAPIPTPLSRSATVPARSAPAFLAHPTRFERVTFAFGALLLPPPAYLSRCRPQANRLNEPYAPVAQLDRALPSEGKGHTFESCRVRQLIERRRRCAPNDASSGPSRSGSWRSHSLSPRAGERGVCLPLIGRLHQRH